jgi:ATP-dependent RNA helicase DeaD
MTDSNENDHVEPDDALPEISFGDLSERLQDAAARAGWSSLMPVQAKAMPYVLAQRDLMVQSKTGSGKTGAFLLPIFERIDLTDRRCQCLILVPTRELAQQVMDEAKMLAGGDGIEAVAVYGGVAYGPQMEAFERGVPLVVGTPGRVLDHLLKRNLTLDGLRMLVFDEADRMLSMGFYPDMQRLKEFVPRDSVNGYMFSATFPQTVISLAREFLADGADFLSLSKDRVHVAETVHAFCDVPSMDKDRALMRIIELENPQSGIIFCNTKANVRYVSVVLKRFGYDADELSSDLSQPAREKVLTKLRQGRLRFLVATDVAGRGIDIDQLSHVFQYEPPQDPEDYIHRVGRTGRAGATGEAITLVSGLEKLQMTHIAKKYEIDLQEYPPPTREQVQEVVSQRLVALLEARLRDRGPLRKERMQRFMPLVRSLAESNDEAQLVAMMLDDYYQDSLHAPPVAPGDEPAPEPSKEPVREDPDRERSGRKGGGSGSGGSGSGGGRRRRRGRGRGGSRG